MFAAPRSIASAPPSGSPPWCFSALTVATSTTALGRRPAGAADDVEELLHAHVGAEAALGDDDTRRASARPRSATSELLPCAMFANGPQWTNAGWPSSVWTRFGLIVSLSSTAIEPAARSCSAVTGSPS